MSLIQDLKLEHKIRAVAIDPVGDKVIRIASQTAKIEASHVFLPRIAPWLGEFQKEALAFPRGHADDQVDALSQDLAYVSEMRTRLRASWGAIKGFY